MTPEINPLGQAPQLPPARPRVRRAANTPTPTPTPAPAPISEPQPEGEPAAPTYSVGYGKPPAHTRFKPGQSGNPKGRPRGAKGLKTMVRETMTATVTVRTGDGTRKMTRMEALIFKTHELAVKGNGRALDHLLKLYAAAVPDQIDEAALAEAEDLTATDLAMLEALRQSLGSGPDYAEPDLGTFGLDDDPAPDAPLSDTNKGNGPSTAAPPDEAWTSDWDREI